MNKHPHQPPTELGEVILAALHRAAEQSDDPHVVVRLATAEVLEILRCRGLAGSAPNKAE